MRTILAGTIALSLAACGAADDEATADRAGSAETPQSAADETGGETGHAGHDRSAASASASPDYECEMSPGGGLEAREPWARAISSVGGVSAAYFSLCNRSEVPVVIIGAASTAANVTELHETSANAQGVMSMKPVSNVVVAPGARVDFRPGGLHVMLIDAREAVGPGEVIAVDLQLESGDVLALAAKTVAAGERH